MTIKTRLSLQFSLLLTIILLIFSILVYFFSFTSQRLKYRENLLRRAQNTAILFRSVPEIDTAALKSIHQSTFLWTEEEMALTDSAFNILYSYNLNYLNKSSIETNYSKSFYNYFSIKEKDGVCCRIKLQNHTYYSFILAYDVRRGEILANLRKMIILSILASVLFSAFFSYLVAKNAIRPLSELIERTHKINSYKIGDNIFDIKRNDEIGKLASSFNDMLIKIENVFRSHEEFVSNASHEIRTPLTIMISESDYLLSRDRTKEEYIEHIRKINNDLARLNLLSNSLLELAQISSTTIPLSSVRVDEIIHKVIYDMKLKYPGRKIVSKILYTENEDDLLVSGNSGLLELAFSNLIDNACKFSADEVIIEVLISDTKLKVVITDKGIGIPPQELEKLFKPFNRASNVKYYSGHGIGLSLVLKIVELHNAKIEMNIPENGGTSVEIIFDKST